MDEAKSTRELMHELGNALQEKVALQYLLTLGAAQIEELAAAVEEDDLKARALNTAERLRRSAAL